MSPWAQAHYMSRDISGLPSQKWCHPHFPGQVSKYCSAGANLNADLIYIFFLTPFTSVPKIYTLNKTKSQQEK